LDNTPILLPKILLLIIALFSQGKSPIYWKITSLFLTFFFLAKFNHLPWRRLLQSS
jgi:phosphoglycerol transferase MdoB-like AlkP superfamily enzyme